MRLTLNRYNNLTQRLVTGFIGAGLVIYASYFSEWTYFFVFLVISCLSILEFYRLTGLDGMLPLKYIGTLNAILIFLLSFLVEFYTINNLLEALCKIKKQEIFFLASKFFKGDVWLISRRTASNQPQFFWRGRRRRKG